MRKIYVPANSITSNPLETEYWTIYQEESTHSDFCHFMSTAPSDAGAKVARFLQIHYVKGYDPAYQGFVQLFEKQCSFDNLPYNKRPIVNAEEVRKAKSAEKEAEKEGAEKTEAPTVNNWGCTTSECKTDENDSKKELSIAEAMQMIFAENDRIRKIKREEFDRKKQAEAKAPNTQKKEKQVKPKVQKNAVTMKKISAPKIENLLQQYTNLYFYRNNYYITANRFRTPMKRSKDQLFGFSNIVLDIDYHGRWGQRITPGEVYKKLNRLMCLLENQFYSILDFYTPNSVVFTGRGLQLWWSLDNTHANAIKMYCDVSNYLCSKLEEFIKADPELEGLSVDRSASGNAAGLYRIPCTYNSATGGYGDVYLRHDNLMNLYDAYKEIFKSGFLAPEKWRNRIQYSYDGKGEFLIAAERRVDALSEIVRMRAAKGEIITRDLFLLIVFCAIITATGDEKQAYSRMLAFNHFFPNPMPEEEAIKYMSTAGRKKYYYKNETIIDLLGITEEEQRLTGFRPAKSQREAKCPGFRKNHKELDVKVLGLCTEGMNRSQIAKECDCSVQTVSRILTANGKKTDEEIIRKKIERSSRTGKSTTKLLKEYAGKMSRSNIYRICKKAKELRDAAKALKEKGKEILKAKRKVQEARQEAEAAIFSEKHDIIQCENPKKEHAFLPSGCSIANKDSGPPVSPLPNILVLA